MAMPNNHNEHLINSCSYIYLEFRVLNLPSELVPKKDIYGAPVIPKSLERQLSRNAGSRVSSAVIQKSYELLYT